LGLMYLAIICDLRDMLVASRFPYSYNDTCPVQNANTARGFQYAYGIEA